MRVAALLMLAVFLGVLPNGLLCLGLPPLLVFFAAPCIRPVLLLQSPQDLLIQNPRLAEHIRLESLDLVPKLDFLVCGSDLLHLLDLDLRFLPEQIQVALDVDYHANFNVCIQICRRLSFDLLRILARLVALGLGRWGDTDGTFNTHAGAVIDGVDATPVERVDSYYQPNYANPSDGMVQMEECVILA